MSPLELAGVAIVVLLAVIAWASAWQTLNWLGEAEDILDEAKRHPLESVDGRLAQRIEFYRRRSPRRS